MKLAKGQTVKKDLPIEIKDLGERSVQFTISKEVEDRDGDILRAGGVDFSNYMKNPHFRLNAVIYSAQIVVESDSPGRGP